MDSEVIVVDGIATLKVENHELVIRDGIPLGSRTRIVAKINRSVKRVVVVARHGSITFDAIKWMHDLGIAYAMINDQEMTAYGAAPGTNARLRRAQSRAIDNQAGIDVTRYIAEVKLAGQRDVLAAFDTHAADAVDVLIPSLALADIDGCREIEARAASLYWQAWQPLPVHWAAKVPEHWQSFGTRYSPISGNSGRNAANPVNAVLNYAYAVLEAEATIACHTMGLDPLLGISHTDQPYRQSMALDLMEIGRPLVDAQILAMVGERVFNKREFREGQTGIVRITPGLHKHVASLVQGEITKCNPHWEHVLDLIGKTQKGPYKRRTPLTSTNRKARFANSTNKSKDAVTA